MTENVKMPTPREVASKLLSQAQSIISTERGTQHGSLEDSFSLIAEWWTTYLNHLNYRTGVPKIVPLTAMDVLEMMTFVKKGRNMYGATIPDHTLDDLGYEALAGGMRLQQVIYDQMVSDAAKKSVGEAISGATPDPGIADIPKFLRAVSDKEPPNPKEGQ